MVPASTCTLTTFLATNPALLRLARKIYVLEIVLTTLRYAVFVGIPSTRQPGELQRPSREKR